LSRLPEQPPTEIDEGEVAPITSAEHSSIKRHAIEVQLANVNEICELAATSLELRRDFFQAPVLMNKVTALSTPPLSPVEGYFLMWPIHVALNGASAGRLESPKRDWLLSIIKFDC